MCRLDWGIASAGRVLLYMRRVALCQFLKKLSDISNSSYAVTMLTVSVAASFGFSSTNSIPRVEQESEYSLSNRKRQISKYPSRTKTL